MGTWQFISGEQGTTAIIFRSKETFSFSVLFLLTHEKKEYLKIKVLSNKESGLLHLGKRETWLLGKSSLSLVTLEETNQITPCVCACVSWWLSVYSVCTFISHITTNVTKHSLILSITKIYLYSFDSLKPHFYTVKLEFTGVYINFLISGKNIDCEYRVPTIYVLSRSMKNIRVFI